MDTDKEKGLFNVYKKISMKCQHCGKKGHRPDDCWYLEKNKESFEKYQYSVLQN